MHFDSFVPEISVFIYIIFLFLLYRTLSGKNKKFLYFIKMFVPFTLLGGMTLYFIGYNLMFKSEGFEHVSAFCRILTSLLMSLFSTGRLFILGNDLIEIHEHVKHLPLFMLWFSVIGASAAFISLSIILHLFGKKIITRFRLLKDRSKSTSIFFSINEESLALANDIRKKNISQCMVFLQHISKTDDISLYNDIEEIGAFPVSCEPLFESLHLKEEEDILQHHGNKAHHAERLSNILKQLKLLGKVINRKADLYFLSENEEHNLDIAHIVLEELNSNQICNEITLHIRISSGDFEEFFSTSFTVASPHIKIDIFNTSEIVARQFIRQYNPVHWISKDTEKAVATSDFNVMSIGFNQSANAVFRKLVEFGQFEGSKFSALILDDEMEVKKGRFVNRYPGLLANYSISFVETAAGSTIFFDLIKHNIQKTDYIVISLGNDEKNIRIALDIREMYIRYSGKPVRIFAQVENNYTYRNIIDIKQEPCITLFGRTRDCFTHDIIVRDSLRELGKMVHKNYCEFESNKKYSCSWDKLDKIKMESNISCAEHIFTKLALIGLTVEQVLALKDENDFLRVLTEKRLLNLAKGEHSHWNALYFANGWNTWELEDTGETIEQNKDSTRKLHACLVSWNDIEKVNNYFSQKLHSSINYYESDYKTVTSIYRNLKSFEKKPKD
jgi:hypothetical protein